MVAALEDRGSTALAVELPNDLTVRSADFAELVRRDAGTVAQPVVLAHSGSGPLLPARMARERLGVEPVEMTTGHCPNVSRPEQLAEVLIEAAGRIT